VALKVAILHCQRDAYDVYIGRGRCPRTGEPGEWVNPFRIGVDGDREEVARRYRVWLWREIQAGRIELGALASLHGKRLGCWCAPRRCHGEVLEAASFWALGQQARHLERRVAELTGRRAEGSGS
jgi:hypothetical protein